jgi:hypothetical protein
MHRNELAHWFLAEQNFNKMTLKREKQVIRELYTMSLDLYRAYRMSYALFTEGEYDADEHNQTDPQMLRKMMLSDAPQEVLKQFHDAHPEKSNRRHATRKKR